MYWAGRPVEVSVSVIEKDPHMPSMMYPAISTLSVQGQFEVSLRSKVASPTCWAIRVLGTNDCGFDVITFGQRFEAEKYTFSKPINEMIFDPQI